MAHSKTESSSSKYAIATQFAVSMNIMKTKYNARIAEILM